MVGHSGNDVAIRKTTMDYAEGWFEGNAGRMARCLHPNLVKRSIEHNPQTGAKTLKHFTKDEMVRFTRDGGGTDLPRDQLYYKIDVLEVFQEVAIVRCETPPYVDYLQLVHDGRCWLILNILYTTK